MNILVPILDCENIDAFISSGADEFYFGLQDDNWNLKYGVFEEINRMSSFGSKANVSIDIAKKMISKIKAHERKVFLTLNSCHYNKNQKNYIKELLSREDFQLLDGIIMSDFTMFDLIKSLGYKITVSTMGAAYNSDIVSFFRDHGADRVILPRDLKITDIETIVSRCGQIEFEVFVMRNGCKYSDAYCMSFHSRKYGSMCSNIDAETPTVLWQNSFTDAYKREVYENNKVFTKAFHKQACGLCSINRFKEMGIASVKIVGRADNGASIIRDIQTVSSFINGNPIGDIKFDNCLYGLNCYYKA